jgi:hypothetical protein
MKEKPKSPITTPIGVDLFMQLNNNNISELYPKPKEKVGFNDCVFYIYTSGTLPSPGFCRSVALTNSCRVY